MATARHTEPEPEEQLLLAEPESAVTHTLKEAFLTLRKAALGGQ